jgi:hypothetical protein
VAFLCAPQAFLAALATPSLRRSKPAVSSTTAVPPPKAPRTGASGRSEVDVVLPDMSIPGMSPGMSPVLVGAGVLPDMSIPGMFAGIVGAGVLPDMSIPGMFAGIVGAGVLPDMSIPGMFAGIVTDGVLPDMSTPAIANDVGLDTSNITPKTALATARMRAEMATRRVLVLLAIEKSSQLVVSC